VGQAPAITTALAAPTPASNDVGLGNFAYIYRNPQLREEFFAFLVKVFHLYPEQQPHQLIQAAADFIKVATPPIMP